MMNISDLLSDLYITRAFILERYKNTIGNKTIKIYLQILRDIENKINIYDDIAPINLTKLLKEIKALVNPNIELDDELSQLYKREEVFAISTVNKAIGVDIVSKVATPKTINNITSSSLLSLGDKSFSIKKWLYDLNKSIVKDIEGVVKLGMVLGETNREISKRVNIITNKNIRYAESITRTSVNAISNQARMSVYKDNSDILGGYEHLSVLDSRTSLVCGVRDGAMWDLEYLPLNTSAKKYGFRQPPLHPNCRSLILPIIKDWEELDNLSNIPKIPKSKRVSIDGRVSGDMTFSKWLKSKPIKFVEQHIGVKRADLFLNNKISLSDLIKSNGKEVPLKDL